MPVSPAWAGRQLDLTEGAVTVAEAPDSEGAGSASGRWGHQRRGRSGARVCHRRASADFKFASAVAAFGMVLRDSEYKGSANLDAVFELAEEGKGRDASGYRADFLQLVKEAKVAQPAHTR